jgi:hypothetical protein
MAPGLVAQLGQLCVYREELGEITQSKRWVFVQIITLQNTCSMVILVEERQVVRSSNISGPSEQSETEACGVRCDGTEATISFAEIVIEKLVEVLGHRFYHWRSGVDQRSWDKRTEKWAGLVERPLSMSHWTPNGKRAQNEREYGRAHIEENGRARCVEGMRCYFACVLI